MKMQKEVHDDQDITPKKPRNAGKFFESGHEILEAIPEEVRKKIKIVYVLAHPDDESTHLVSIELLQQLGFQLVFVWLTNGDGSTDAAVKKEESKKVLGALGISELHFLDHSVYDINDEVLRSPKELRDKRLRELVAQIRERTIGADIIVTNTFEGGHALHDLTRLLVEAAAEDFQKILEIPQYSLKTVSQLMKSFFRACIHRCLRKHIFYNVGNYRDGDLDSLIGIKTKEAGDIVFPGKFTINPGGELHKLAQFRSYQSQWEKVIAPFLDAVEFNGTASLELYREARPIPSLWQTIMHLEKWLLSFISGVIHPKKIYEVKEALEAMKGEATSSEPQSPISPQSQNQATA